MRSPFYTIGLIAFLLATACSPIARYRNLDEVKAWEDEIQELEARDRQEQYSGNAILFTGSSSIRLWETIQEDLKPYEVIQRGYGGAKFSDFAVYSERIINPHDFRALVIFVANDVTGGENDKTPEEVLRLFSYIVNNVREKYPEKPIFFIQMTPTRSRWKAWDKIQEVNNAVRQYCETIENLHFIETAEHFLGDDGTPKGELFREDQLHLNEDGYKVWTDVIRRNLDRVLS